MKKTLVILWLLSLLDGIFTWVAVSRGWAREINPLMAWALDFGPVFFFTFKQALMGFGCWGLHSLYTYKSTTTAKWVVGIYLVIYGGVNILHTTMFTVAGLWSQL